MMDQTNRFPLLLRQPLQVSRRLIRIGFFVCVSFIISLGPNSARQKASRRVNEEEVLRGARSLNDRPEVKSAGFVRVSGRKLVVGALNNEVLLRGVVVFASPTKPVSDKDYEDISALGFNVVRLVLGHRLFYEPGKKTTYKESGWKLLDTHIGLARKHRIYLVLQMLDVEGAQFVPVKDTPFDYRIWENPKLKERFIELWQNIASRYRNESQIAGYSLFGEPVVSGDISQWSNLAQQTVKAIREVDKNHIVFIERIYGEHGVRREISGEDLPPEVAFFLVPDNNIVYEFYFFERDEYTHQFARWRSDVQLAMPYPDLLRTIEYREPSISLLKKFNFDKTYLSFYLNRQLEFGRNHNVPMFVWGFGLLRTCSDRGGTLWLKDVLDLFTTQNLHWTFVSYRDNDFIDLSENEVKRIFKTALQARAN